MQKKLLGFTLALLVMFTAMFSMVPVFAMEAGGTDFTIVNPYETVDWASYGQYKADFHSHSVESDGGNQPAEMIEDHYAKGFDIMALSDHNVTNTTWDRTDSDKTYLTSERLAEINAGTDRGGRGMIGIPYSNEQSRSDHLNTFWADFNNQSGATLEGNIAQCESLGGISHINHPGRYTGGRNTANNGADGEAASSQPATVAKYVRLFETYPSCVGMEIINKKDGDSYSDRILWDNILKQTMPERPVWGFSNDDTHAVANTGFSYNMMLMPENTLENVRYSMENGTFYAVAKVSKRELGAGFVSTGETPVISNIAVDQDANSITIEGQNYHTIEWIANGKIIATGNTIDLNDYEDQITTYVRAQLKGDGGISFTQPFGVKKLSKNEELIAIAKVYTGQDVVIKEETQEIEFNVALGQIKDLNALDATFTFDNQLIRFKKAELMVNNNALMNSSVKDGHVRIIAGFMEAVTSQEYKDILKLTFELADPQAENVTANLHIDSVLTASSGVNKEVASNVEVANAAVAVKSYKILCDVDGNGKLGIGDLSTALDHYRANSQDPNWNEAKHADVNMDGVVDIADFTIIMANIFEQQ